MIKKAFPIFFVFLILICAASASNAETEKDDDRLSEMMAAEMFAFGLEGMIFDAQSEFTSYNDVFNFFRQGFCESLSKKLAANIWNDGKVKLKDGDQIMESPKEVYIRLIKPNVAAVSFETPKHRKHIWG